jgi:hypothetical protein
MKGHFALESWRARDHSNLIFFIGVQNANTVLGLFGGLRDQGKFERIISYMEFYMACNG